MRTQTFAITLAVAAALLVPVPAQNLDVELQRAIQKETVTGDLKAAIEEYKKIVAHAGSDRAPQCRRVVSVDRRRRCGEGASKPVPICDAAILAR